MSLDQEILHAPLQQVPSHRLHPTLQLQTHQQDGLYLLDLRA